MYFVNKLLKASFGMFQEKILGWDAATLIFLIWYK